MGIANPQMALQLQMLRAMQQSGNEGAQLLNQQGGQVPMPASAQTSGTGQPGFTGNMPAYGQAISNIESGGDYGQLGPATKSGDRAYGKYQVMGENIGPWTEQILGKRMTPDEFLADPKAQDAVFQGKFGEYLTKTGNPQDAASMWFSGKPLAQAANLKDQLGTSGQDYVTKFNLNLPPAMRPGAVQPTAMPAQVATAQGGPTEPPGSSKIQNQIDQLQKFLLTRGPYLNPTQTEALKGRIADLQKNIQPTPDMIAAASLGMPLQQYLFMKSRTESMGQVPQELRIAQAAGMTNPLEYEQRKAEAAGVGNVAKETFQKASEGYQAAQSTMYRLDLIDRSIKDLGPQWMGTQADKNVAMQKAMNTIVDRIPFLSDSVKEKLHIADPAKIASAEDFQKQTQNLGFEVAKSLGSREAQMIVQQAVAAVPNANQSYLGAQLVSAGIRQAMQRQMDFYEFLAQRPQQGKSVIGAEIEFNRLHPPSEYSQKALGSIQPSGTAPAAPAVPTLPQGATMQDALAEIQRRGGIQKMMQGLQGASPAMGGQ